MSVDISGTKGGVSSETGKGDNQFIRRKFIDRKTDESLSFLQEFIKIVSSIIHMIIWRNVKKNLWFGDTVLHEVVSEP